MEIKDGNVILSAQEQARTGLSSPLEFKDVDNLFLENSAKRQGLEAMRAADDDELTRAERASIPQEIMRVQETSKLLGTILLAAHSTDMENLPLRPTG